MKYLLVAVLVCSSVFADSNLLGNSKEQLQRKLYSYTLYSYFFTLEEFPHAYVELRSRIAVIEHLLENYNYYYATNTTVQTGIRREAPFDRQRESRTSYQNGPTVREQHQDVYGASVASEGLDQRTK